MRSTTALREMHVALVGMAGSGKSGLFPDVKTHRAKEYSSLVSNAHPAKNPTTLQMTSIQNKSYDTPDDEINPTALQMTNIQNKSHDTPHDEYTE
ncbi:hypothetical protein Y032_0070g490 [Ancylostoma ceylanicum]|uniref:Uncharacterized protein n=1 Tax=Ancylostoma ceylanicum TaxID=53326 RepID=A0A016TXS8_9BILA|nr:hypothetical protein Y032_0070g490 [Ancylostoma ceylanicum]